MRLFGGKNVNHYDSSLLTGKIYHKVFMNGVQPAG
jgi:hypothetical protein